MYNMEERELKTEAEDDLSSSCPELELACSHGRTTSGMHIPTVQSVLRIYEELIQFVEQKDFDGHLREELNNAVKGNIIVCKAEPRREQKINETHQPEYIEEFTTRMKDLERMECGITITGETSSGKTSLMNKLVGNMLVTPRHLPATSRIVRIRNSEEKLKYHILDKEGNEVESETLNRTKKMREKLDKYSTDKNEEDKDFHYIDVYCPFKKLQVQGNVMLVDTPGIGESDKMTNMLLEYLPNSFAFIFLIDVSRAGGVQKDRIQKILETIIEEKSKMPCFELEDVLFVTNKWNYIVEITDQEEDESDEEDEDQESNKEDKQKKSEKEKTWIEIVKKLKEVWPSLNMEKIYKLNLQKVTETEDTEEEKLEFQKFCRVLSEMLEKNKHKRKRTHLRYLDKTIRSIENGILARINAATGDDEDQIKDLQSSYEELDRLKYECAEIRQILERRIDHAVSSLSRKLSYFLYSAEGKEKILNPPGQERIEKKKFSIFAVSNRLKTGIIKWMEGPEVLHQVNEIEEQILKHFTDVKRQIKSAQLTVTGELKSPDEKLEASDIAALVLLSPILLTGSILVGSIGIVAGTLLSPLILLGTAVQTDADRKNYADVTYYKEVKKWEKEDKIKSLNSILQKHFDKKINAIFVQELPQEITNTAGVINNLLKKRGYTKENYDTFLRLKEGIQKLRSDVRNMLMSFEEL